jgi:phytol kinase
MLLAARGRRGFLSFLALALVTSCFASAFSSVRETFPVARRAELKTFPTGTGSPKPNPQPNPRIGPSSTSLYATQETKPDNNIEEAISSEDESSAAKTEDDNNDDASERQQGKTIVVTTLVSGLTAVIAAAKTGILRGPLDLATGEYGLYTDAMILRDTGSTAIAAALAFVLVKAITLGYEKGVYDSKISRKLSHTLSAPLFMLFYPIFSPADGARFFAGLVAFVNGVRLYLAGSGSGDSSLARSVSRSGDKSEALGGPFIYVCLFELFILLFWRSNVIGIIAASTMAAGDGMADLVGRKWGRNNKWWFSEDKSIAGSTAFAVSSSLTSFGLVNWLSATGCLETSLGTTDLAIRIIAISVICAMVELLPIGDDNYTVPLSAAALASLLLT